MSDLRKEAIIHMGQAIARRWVAARPGPDPSPTATTDANAALDALLDFLDAHTEEWEDDADVETESSIRLVAALRGTTEEQ